MKGDDDANVFSDELSDVFQVGTDLMPPPPGLSAPPPPATPKASEARAASFTAVGPAPVESSRPLEAIGGFRAARVIDPIEPWERHVAVDGGGGKHVLWSRVMTAAEASALEVGFARLAKVRHPGVAKPAAHGYERGRFFVAYPRLEGAALETVMRGVGDQPAAVTVLVVSDVLDALAAAHAVGLVHGSVQPRAIRLSADGRAVLHGFALGLNAPVDERAGQRRVAHASPEQCAGRAGDAAGDLHGCGVLLYEMLTGMPPFARGTVRETLAAVTSSRSPSLLDHALHVPWLLDDVCAALLAREPVERFPSAEAARRALGPLVDAVKATHDGALARYATSPSDEHARLTKVHADAELLVAKELLSKDAGRQGAAALALLRARALDPASQEITTLLRRTMARAGFSLDEKRRSSIRELEGRLASSPDDRMLLEQLCAAARSEGQLSHLVRYLSRYVRMARDDDAAKRELDALRPRDLGAPFMALTRPKR